MIAPDIIGIVVAVGSFILLGRKRVVERRVEIAERTVLDLDLRITGQLKDLEDRNAALASVYESVNDIYIERRPEQNAASEWAWNWTLTTAILVAVWLPRWLRPLPEGGPAVAETVAHGLFQAYVVLSAVRNIFEGHRWAARVKRGVKSRATKHAADLKARKAVAGTEQTANTTPDSP